MAEQESSGSDPSAEGLEPESESSEGYVCPLCGEPQPYFIYESRCRGWVECPGCSNYSPARRIPQEFIKVVEDRAEPTQPREGAPVEEEGDEYRGSVRPGTDF